MLISVMNIHLKKCNFYYTFLIIIIMIENKNSLDLWVVVPNTFKLVNNNIFLRFYILNLYKIALGAFKMLPC